MAETWWRRTAAMIFRIALQPRAAGKTNNYLSCKHTTLPIAVRPGDRAKQQRTFIQHVN